MDTKLTLTIDEKLIDQVKHFARQNKRSVSDLEDALQNFSAVYNEKIDVIITRNVKDFKKSSAAVMTPDLFLKSLQSLDT